MSGQSLHPHYVSNTRPVAAARPAGTRPGPASWIRKNLFSTPLSGALTVCFILLAIWFLHQLLSFSVVSAVWSGGNESCRANPNGACWPFIAEKLNYLRYGAYPASERWRVDLTLASGAVLIVWLLWNLSLIHI